MVVGKGFFSHTLCRSGSNWEGYEYQYVPFDNSVSIQVDYVHVFVTKEYLDEMDADISAFLNKAQELIDELANRGEDTTHLNIYYNQARALWREGYYLYPPAKARLVPFMEVLYNWDKIKSDFTAAEAAIDTLYAQGENRTALKGEADLEKARVFWEECDYESTNEYLQIIQASVPEERILIILGLIIPYILSIQSHRKKEAKNPSAIMFQKNDWRNSSGNEE